MQIDNLIEKKLNGNETISLPKEIRHMSIMVFLFMLWWGLGPDVYLGIYIEKIIPYAWIVGIIWALLSGVKLALCIPIGYLDDKVDEKILLTISKTLYATSGICNFLAGFLHMPILLIIGIILNGLASPIFFTTSYAIIRKTTTAAQATKAFGLFNSCLRWGDVIGALLISLIANKLPIQYMFLCMVFFAIITIPRQKKQSSQINNREKITDTLLHETQVYSTIEHDMAQYNKTMYMTLILQVMYGMINYITLLFVPIMASIHNMDLSQIAILFAIAYIPQTGSYYLSSIWKNYNKFIVSCCALLCIGLLLWLFSMTENFIVLCGIMLAIGTLLATINPLISGFISSITQARHLAEITGVQEFCTRIGEIIGSLAMAIAIAIEGMQNGFIAIATCIIIANIILVSIHKEFQLPTISRYTKQKFLMYNIIEKFSHRILHRVD